MENNYQEVAQRLSNEGYNFDMGKYLKEGWKLGLSSIGPIILYMILVVIISFILGLIPIVGQIADSFFISPVLSAGGIYFLHHKHTTGESDFGKFFEGFKQIGALAGVNILSLLLMMLAVIPMILSSLTLFDMDLLSRIAAEDSTAMLELLEKFTTANAALIGGIVLTFLLLITISILLFTAYYFVAIGKLGGGASIKASAGLAKKNFFSILGFVIVLGLINVLGIMVVVVGLIVTIPVTLGAMYMMFNNIVISQVSTETMAISEDDILDA